MLLLLSFFLVANTGAHFWSKSAVCSLSYIARIQSELINPHLVADRDEDEGERGEGAAHPDHGDPPLRVVAHEREKAHSLLLLWAKAQNGVSPLSWTTTQTDLVQWTELERTTTRRN